MLHMLKQPLRRLFTWHLSVSIDIPTHYVGWSFVPGLKWKCVFLEQGCDTVCLKLHMLKLSYKKEV